MEKLYSTGQETYPIRHDELCSNPPRRLLLCGQNPVYPHDRRGRQGFSSLFARAVSAKVLQ